MSAMAGYNFPMFEWSEVSFVENRRLTRRDIIVGLLVPPVASVLCLLWATFVSDRPKYGVPELPLAIWWVGLVVLGIVASLFILRLSEAFVGRIGLVLATWLYLVIVAAGTAAVGVIVFFVAGRC